MKILIVDDENISRKVLKKKMELIGECIVVDDSLKAIQKFDDAIKIKKPFDLITMDISMPKMDGKQLLAVIRRKEKTMKIQKKDRVKIIMVTSRMNKSTIKECIKLGCDGYISKPVNKYQLLGNLGRMGFEQPANIEQGEEMTKIQIVGKIIKRFNKGQIGLPVLPGIVREVDALLASEDPSMGDLAKIIKKDITITGKLISIANSALYKGVDPVENLTTALLRLGMAASQGLISTLVTKDLFKSDHKILNDLLDKLWMHSFACGCFGKRIAEELGNKNSENLLLMGIVHDIGEMLLIKALADMNPEENFREMELQYAIYEIHTIFGATLLKKLRFSNEFIHIAEFHHWNDFSKNEDQDLLIINLSDHLANIMDYSFFDLEENNIKDQDEILKYLKNLKSREQLNLSPQKVFDISQEVKKTIRETANVF